MFALYLVGWHTSLLDDIPEKVEAGSNVLLMVPAWLSSCQASSLTALSLSPIHKDWLQDE